MAEPRFDQSSDHESPVAVRDSARVQLGWLAVQSAITPRRAPGHVLHAARLLLAFIRARRRFVRALRSRSGERDCEILRGLEPSISASLGVAELNRVAGLVQTYGGAAAITELLRIDAEDKRFPREVCARLLRERELEQAARGEIFPVPERAAHRVATGSRNIIMAFHSGAPLVENGYAARSEEMLGAVEQSGRVPVPVLRLGYPQELARFRGESRQTGFEQDGRHWTLLPDGLNGLLGRSLSDYVRAYGERLAKLAETHDSGVIHAASNYLNGLAAAHAAALSGGAAIYEVRGLWHVTRAGRGDGDQLVLEASEALEIEAAARADAVIAISNAVKGYMTTRGVDPARITVIPNTVCPQTFSPRPRNNALIDGWGVDNQRPLIGYVGSFADYEGLDVLLDALARLKSRSVGFQAVLLGDGPQRGELMNQAARLGLQELVKFPGRIARRDVPTLYNSLDIAPLPRRDLPVTRLVPPIKLVEAMACGTAIVLSDLPALTDVAFPGVHCLGARPDDPLSLAECLEHLCEDPDKRDELGMAARRQVVEHHSRSAAATKLDQIYGRLNR